MAKDWCLYQPWCLLPCWHPCCSHFCFCVPSKRNGTELPFYLYFYLHYVYSITFLVSNGGVLSWSSWTGAMAWDLMRRSGPDDLASRHHLMHPLGQRSKQIFILQIHLLPLSLICSQCCLLYCQALKAADRVFSATQPIHSKTSGCCIEKANDGREPIEATKGSINPNESWWQSHTYGLLFSSLAFQISVLLVISCGISMYPFLSIKLKLKLFIQMKSNALIRV